MNSYTGPSRRIDRYIPCESALHNPNGRTGVCHVDLAVLTAIDTFKSACIGANSSLYLCYVVSVVPSRPASYTPCNVRRESFQAVAHLIHSKVNGCGLSITCFFVELTARLVCLEAAPPLASVLLLINQLLRILIVICAVGASFDARQLELCARTTVREPPFV